MVDEHPAAHHLQQEACIDSETDGLLRRRSTGQKLKQCSAAKAISAAQSQPDGKDGAIGTSHRARAPKSPTSVSPSSATSFQTATFRRILPQRAENWQLTGGDFSDQDSWENSKTSVPARGNAQRLRPLAKLGNTRAAVNPDTANTVDLNVVDSGRPSPLATLESPGTQRYPEQQSPPAWRAQPGTPYDLDLLLDFQQALEQNGIIRKVRADFDRLQGDRVPVKVSVTEVKRQ